MIYFPMNSTFQFDNKKQAKRKIQHFQLPTLRKVRLVVPIYASSCLIFCTKLLVIFLPCDILDFFSFNFLSPKFVLYYMSFHYKRIRLKDYLQKIMSLIGTKNVNMLQFLKQYLLSLFFKFPEFLYCLLAFVTQLVIQRNTFKIKQRF